MHPYFGIGLFSMMFTFTSIILSLIFVLSDVNYFEAANASSELISKNHPNVSDSNLKVELVFQKDIKHKGNTLSPVSTMAFLGPDDILLLDKNNGTVNRIVNGVLLKEPLLDVNVANKRERGMLGIATATAISSTAKRDQKDETTYVFLYYTRSEKSDGSDVCPETYSCELGTYPIGNQLYRYELNDNRLINPVLLLNLPAWPAPSHNGGIIKIGPDNNLYITIGDLVGSANESSRTKAQNYKNGTEPDGRAGILRLTQEGKPVFKGILGSEYPLNLYYAYGIRNSFGIDFDPVTGELWDTENGPDYGDEINLVKPGFNSGWSKIQGIWKPKYDALLGGDLIAGKEVPNPDNNDLVNFDGKGNYSEPEFIWNNTVGPTAIKFLNSGIYGKGYENDLFVGDNNNGYLYHFDLNGDRSGLLLKGPLKDKIANSLQELKGVVFGQNFGSITDLDVGPDGFLYILSHQKNSVEIYRIIS
jgi:glucose/arabinose dehydrogenase